MRMRGHSGQSRPDNSTDITTANDVGGAHSWRNRSQSSSCVGVVNDVGRVSEQSYQIRAALFP